MLDVVLHIVFDKYMNFQELVDKVGGTPTHQLYTFQIQ